MQLFFVLGAVQTLLTWVLADSGSVRNLISNRIYKKLQYQSPIRVPGNCKVIGGKSKPFNLKKFTILSVTLGTTLLCYKFGVVPKVSLKVLIGADVLSSHQCSLHYSKNNKKRVLFGQ